jgi:hypothetical protein
MEGGLQRFDLDGNSAKGCGQLAHHRLGWAWSKHQPKQRPRGINGGVEHFLQKAASGQQIRARRGYA